MGWYCFGRGIDFLYHRLAILILTESFQMGCPFVVPQDHQYLLVSCWLNRKFILFLFNTSAVGYLYLFIITLFLSNFVLKLRVVRINWCSLCVKLVQNNYDVTSCLFIFSFSIKFILGFWKMCSCKSRCSQLKSDFFHCCYLVVTPGCYWNHPLLLRIGILVSFSYSYILV